MRHESLSPMAAVPNAALPLVEKSRRKKTIFFSRARDDQTIFKNTFFLIIEQPLIIILLELDASYFLI